MDYPASGGIGEEGVSVADCEAGKKISAHSLSQGITHQFPSVEDLNEG